MLLLFTFSGLFVRNVLKSYVHKKLHHVQNTVFLNSQSMVVVKVQILITCEYCVIDYKWKNNNFRMYV